MALPDAYISRADLARQSLDPRSRGTQFRARYQSVLLNSRRPWVFRTISIMKNCKAYFEQNLANVGSKQKCMSLKIRDFHLQISAAPQNSPLFDQWRSRRRNGCERRHI